MSISDWFAPLGSPFLALLVPLICLPWMRRFKTVRGKTLALLLPVAIFFLTYYGVSSLSPRAATWVSALNNPLSVAYLFLVLPALLLPDGPLRRWFRVIPLTFLILLGVGIYLGYQTVPAEQAGHWYWILVNPLWLICGVVALLVLLQPYLPLRWFRLTVRVLALLILLYGGFALRANYVDYQEMQSLRTQPGTLMTLNETTPVMRSDDSLFHLMSAPCRFSPDGGYVQGCSIELAQRGLQLNYSKVMDGDTGERKALERILASATIFLLFSFLIARWACGWLCPLSTVGDGINGIRRLLGFAPWRPSPPVKKAYLFSGLGVLGLSGVMAAAYPYIDGEGKIFGVKIPVFPFCKLCPQQQICPVLGNGPSAYPPLPGTEWAYGIFRYGCVVMIVFFVLSFLLARRIWCRFCPMGMISGVFNRGGMMTLVKDGRKCNRCGACTEACPMDIEVVRDEMDAPDVTEYHCVLCLECVEVCPRDKCLSLAHAGKTVKESKFE